MSRDKRVKLRNAEASADFWVKMAKPERNGEYPKRSRVSARKAKNGLSRARRLLDQQVLEEAHDEEG